MRQVPCDVCNEDRDARGFALHMKVHKRRGELKINSAPAISFETGAIDATIELILDHPEAVREHIEQRIAILTDECKAINEKLDRLQVVLGMLGDADGRANVVQHAAR